MKTVTTIGCLTVAAMLTPSVFAQRPDPRQPERREPGFMVLAGRGSEIGVQVVDAKDGGVVVEEVRPDSPAEKAGLKRADVVIAFDGERVRGTRQFGRLVQETPPGRTVKATIMRDGQKKDVQITPHESRGVLGRGAFDGDLLRGQRPELDWMRSRLPPEFNFNFNLPDVLAGRRLGVTVEELTDQLAQYFGVKEGVLVTSVADGSAASRAGLTAGDVITSIGGAGVRSRDDLVRSMRDATDDEVKIVIVRERRETTITAKLESSPRRGVRL